MNLHIGQTISITTENFKHLAKYRGLVLSFSAILDNSILYIYYNHTYNNYYTIPSHEFNTRDTCPGIIVQYSWRRMAAGHKYTVVAYSRCTANFKKLH